MNHYALLRHPGHNHVYFQNSSILSQEELKLMGLPIENVEETIISGLSYLTFSSENPLEEKERKVIARLSSTYGLFEVKDQLFSPISLPNPQILDRSVATILKYQGKTNEIFTRMLINLALSQGGFSPENVKLLDPVAGRGTTLFEGFSLGADVYGVEVQEKSVQEGQAHLKKFLETGKIKHKTNTIRVSGPNKSFTAKKHTIDMGEQHFELISGDSKDSHHLFSPNFFHIIVGDLPYGVQHGNHAGGKHRSPAQLLTTCLRPWHKVLKDNGILVLSWNTLVLPRSQMVSLLLKNGYQILKSDSLDALEHQVDASILRDIIVAKKQ